MRECFIYLAESDAVEREKLKERLKKKDPMELEEKLRGAIVQARGKKKRTFQLIDWAESAVYNKESQCMVAK